MSHIGRALDLFERFVLAAERIAAAVERTPVIAPPPPAARPTTRTRIVNAPAPAPLSKGTVISETDRIAAKAALRRHQ